MDWTQILIGGGVAAIANFMWYAVAWMALPHHKGDFKSAKGNDDLERGLAQLGPANEFYAIPHMDDYAQGMKDPELAQRMDQGPNALVCVYPPGQPMSGGTFVKGFLLNVIEAVLAAILLYMVAEHVPSLMDKVMLFGSIGIFISVSSYLALHVWMIFPLRYCLTSTFDKVIGYSLIGVVLHFLGPGS